MYVSIGEDKKGVAVTALSAVQKELKLKESLNEESNILKIYQ
jgi:hypothetical protein